MEGYESEKEQIEALKKWWKENGSSAITGVLLGLAVIFGGKAWFSYQQRQNEAASHLYMQLLNGLGSDDAAMVSEAGDKLISEYSDSPYASFAAFGLAKKQVEEGNLDAARAQLQWVLDHAGLDSIRNSARVRLVRLLIAAGEPDAADALLKQAPADAQYVPLYAELRGDLARERGNRDAARDAYREALAGMAEDAPNRILVQTKLDDVL